MDNRSLPYNCIYVFLIIAFTYFYTAITLNPTQMAEDMKRNNGFIPGIKPGKDTADYIDTIMTRITFPGSLFIAFIAVMPALAGLLNVQQAFSQFFGGTSLLILVGVVIDTIHQIESHMLMRHYDGLLGRTGVVIDIINKSRVICLCATMIVGATLAELAGHKTRVRW